MRNSYEDRLRRVLRYIHDNPAGDLSLDRLAEVAAMSRFHWHRVFRAMTGETCAEAVRRIRIERAAFALMDDTIPLAEVAASVGYDNLRSFNRAFREVHDMTPTAFRRHGVPGRAAFRLRTTESDMFDIEIKDLTEMRLAVLYHKGAYTEAGKTFDQLKAILSDQALWPQTRGMIGVYFDDPTSKPAEELMSCAGVIIGEEFDMPESLEELRQPGGRHGVLTFEGPYSGLHTAYDYLYGSWLPGSGEEPADAPPFELYLNMPDTTAPADLRTQICAPLRG